MAGQAQIKLAEAGVRRNGGVVRGMLAAYYRIPAVQARMVEYCGGTSFNHSSAFGFAAYGGKRQLRLADGAPSPIRVEEIDVLLEEGADFCRSLADRDGTLIHMDIDYVDPGDPAEIHLRPELCFARIEPVYRAVHRAFQDFGVPTIDLISARGYHLSTRIPAGTPFHAALLDIGRIGAPLEAKYQSLGGERWVRLGRAHEGAGRLLEHLSHRVLRALGGKMETPVTLGDLPRPAGGPYVCLDLSAYGDPLSERNIRCAFSSNQKAGEVTPEQPFTINLPRRKQPLSRLLRIRREPLAAARMAARVHAYIPNACGENLRWVEDYRKGALARFHAEFDRGWHDAPEQWPRTYDKLDLRTLPACVRLPLEQPNPSLLQPVWIRTVALALWGMGWHPRSVAGLIRSKYERDFGWGSMWYRYDAATRADFYVRLFCGALACGLDQSFSCEDQAARGACPVAGFDRDLSGYRCAIERRL